LYRRRRTTGVSEIEARRLSPGAIARQTDTPSFWPQPRMALRLGFFFMLRNSALCRRGLANGLLAGPLSFRGLLQRRPYHFDSLPSRTAITAKGNHCSRLGWKLTRPPEGLPCPNCDSPSVVYPEATKDHAAVACGGCGTFLATRGQFRQLLERQAVQSRMVTTRC
jgi:hypothetical protein